MKGAVLLLVVAVVLALPLGQAVADTRPVTTPATLRLMDAEPVALRGTGFKPRELVRVVVTTTTRAVKSVSASAHGAFVVHFTGIDASSCVGFTATATGNHGSRASFKRVPGQCAAP